MGTVCFSETSVHFHRPTRRYIADGTEPFSICLTPPVSEAMLVDVGPGILWLLKCSTDRWLFYRNSYHTVRNAGYKYVVCEVDH
jgi:hypothetical protein